MQNGTMLADDFGASIVAFSRLYRAVAGRNLVRPRAVEVRLTAEFKEGSFEAVLQLVHQAVSTVQSTFGPNVGSATDCVKLIEELIKFSILILGVPPGVAILLHHRKKAEAKRLKAEQDLENSRLEGQSRALEIEKQRLEIAAKQLELRLQELQALESAQGGRVLLLAEDPEVRRLLRAFLQPAIEGHVDNIKFSGTGSPVSVSGSELRIAAPERRSQESGPFEAEIELAQANTFRANGWKFRMDEEIINATIHDRRFLSKVRSGLDLNTRARLRVRMTETIYWDASERVRKRYDILEVLS